MEEYFLTTDKKISYNLKFAFDLLWIFKHALHGNQLIEARLVGGVVRDLLSNRQINDIDIAISSLPEQTMAYLTSLHIKTIPTGINYGTITAFYKENFFEITSLRRDIKNNGRHPIVSFTKNFEEDALRRDFTINALYMDADGNIHDYTGGMQDLKHNIVRFIGVPFKRIHEDYLRVWRYYRFLELHNASSAQEIGCLFSYETGLLHLSKERIRQELFKWLSLFLSTKTKKFAQNLKGICEAQKNGLFKLHFGFEPDLILFKEVLASVSFFSEIKFSLSPLLLFYSLFHQNIKTVSHLLKRQEKYYLTLLQKLIEKKNPLEVLYDSLYVYHSFQLYWDWVMIKNVFEQGVFCPKEAENFAVTYFSTIFPIQGEDLITKVEACKIGKTLKLLRTKWGEERGQISKEDLLSSLRKHPDQA